jgi:hypothetical protein
MFQVSELTLESQITPLGSTCRPIIIIGGHCEVRGIHPSLLLTSVLLCTVPSCRTAVHIWETLFFVEEMSILVNILER